MTSEDFKKDFDKNEPVIEIETGSLITNAVYAESSQGLSLCANIERYTGESSMGKCFLRGFYSRKWCYSSDNRSRFSQY